MAKWDEFKSVTNPKQWRFGRVSKRSRLSVVEERDGGFLLYCYRGSDVVRRRFYSRGDIVEAALDEVCTDAQVWVERARVPV